MGALHQVSVLGQDPVDVAATTEVAACTGKDDEIAGIIDVQVSEDGRQLVVELAVDHVPDLRPVEGYRHYWALLGDLELVVLRVVHGYLVLVRASRSRGLLAGTCVETVSARFGFTGQGYELHGLR